MKKMKFLTLGMCVAVLVSCGSSMKNGALIGTGAGAALGAIIGKIAGNTAVGAAVGGAVGAATGAIIGKKMDKAKAEAEAVKVTFDSGILFNTGSSTLSSAAKTSLTQFAGVLKNNADCDVAVQGYTDNTPFKNSTAEQSAQKNVQLSQQRAQAVTSFLNSLGVSNSQIRSTIGYGEANPVADNSTAAGKAQNRRVEVYMYASEAMIKAAEAGTLQ